MRFYFDVNDGRDLVVDHDGLECLDLDAAKLEAAKALGEIGRDALPSLIPPVDLFIRIRDESGLDLLRVTISFMMHMDQKDGI